MPAKKPKRPVAFSKAAMFKICAEISNGKSLVRVCKMPGMPTRKTAYEWMHRYPEFMEAYKIAQLERADYLAEEALEIADTAEDAGIGRLRVDTRKWFVAQMSPKKWGTKTVVEGGENALRVASITADMPPEVASQIYKELLG